MATNGQRSVYLDNMANTPVDPRVIEAIIPHLKGTYGNPLNLHDEGQKTLAVFENSRKQVAELIGALPAEIIFTSCGSESIDLALRGIAQAYSSKGKHIITSGIEHFSVLYTLKDLEKEGYKVTYLPVDKNGSISPDSVVNAITNETVLISLTHASNEIGTIEPISEIAKAIKGKEIKLHIDGMQTVGNIPVNVADLGADAISFSANQFYGPTGIAALYIKKGTRVVPQLRGGTQEDGKRAGTQNIPGIIGMGKACELAKLEMNDRAQKMIKLRDKLIAALPKKIEDFAITGHPTQRLPGHVSGRAKYVEGESMSMFLNMQGIAVSTGSACASKALKASHVLIAIGVSPEDVHGSLVFSLGKDTTEADIDHVIEKLPPIVERLRQMSPLYLEKKESR
jgi:cysteine desulfurase